MNLKFNRKNYKSNLVEFSDERVAFLKASLEADIITGRYKNLFFKYLFFKNIFNFFCFKKMRYITVNQLFNMLDFRPKNLTIYVN